VRYIQGTMGAKNPTLPRLGRKGWILGGVLPREDVTVLWFWGPSGSHDSHM
jgi:hypothetical protein